MDVAQGVVPFRFACQRSGHCCSGGSGHVWLAEGEAATLAGRLGMSLEAFTRTHLRTVPDPRDGRLRTSLVEWDGRCVLLEGARHCTVYGDRPAQCRSFPYWEEVLTDPVAFERARATCPGLAVVVAVVVEEERRAAAFEALAALYREVDEGVEASGARCRLSGLCCRFEEADHELYATGLEADYAAEHHPQAPPPEAPGRCPYQVAGRCTARAGRPLACRTYFCDPDQADTLAAMHEGFLARIRAMAEEAGYPPTYGRFPPQLAARGIGTGMAMGGVGGKIGPRAPSEEEP